VHMRGIVGVWHSPVRQWLADKGRSGFNCMQTAVLPPPNAALPRHPELGTDAYIAKQCACMQILDPWLCVSVNRMQEQPSRRVVEGLAGNLGQSQGV
jgi:hypothetical protein